MFKPRQTENYFSNLLLVCGQVPKLRDEGGRTETKHVEAAAAGPQWLIVLMFKAAAIPTFCQVLVLMFKGCVPRIADNAIRT